MADLWDKYRVEYTSEVLERGHRVDRIFSVWNINLQTHVCVVIHSRRCPGCYLENKKAGRKGGG